MKEGEHWTQDVPEVGCMYWITRAPDADHNFWRRPLQRRYNAKDVAWWQSVVRVGGYRSVDPIPDPIPPPLPSTKP